ncbi:MAG TPA: hypothetical protein DCL21_04465 [Alphaproteobacteria bacterium]|nr:hypothetical protein [Alphaproteobacteria bacterium]
MKKITLMLTVTLSLFTFSAQADVTGGMAKFVRDIFQLKDQATQGAKDGASHGNEMCLRMEKNYAIVIQNELFSKTTGKVIQKQWEEGNTDAGVVMAHWMEILGNPDPEDFSDRWIKFWRKELNHYVFFETYRCNKYGAEMVTVIEETEKFMRQNDYPGWGNNFNTMFDSMAK